MIKQKSAKRNILLAAAFLAVAVCLIFFFTFYANADNVEFLYADANVCKAIDASEGGYDEWIYDNGYGGRYPCFGNAATLSKQGYNVESPFKIYPAGAIENYEKIYQQLNDPLYSYAFCLTHRYDNLVKMEWTAENDGMQITVNFDNTAYPDGLDGEAERFSKTFTFDISNVSPDHPPVLDQESKTYLNELNQEIRGFPLYE